MTDTEMIKTYQRVAISELIYRQMVAINRLDNVNEKQKAVMVEIFEEYKKELS